MSITEMFDVLEELEAIRPSVAWSDELTNRVEMRIASLQKQVDEYNVYIEQLAEQEEYRVQML